jgi:hypothetical protein
MLFCNIVGFTIGIISKAKIKTIVIIIVATTSTIAYAKPGDMLIDYLDEYLRKPCTTILESADRINKNLTERAKQKGQ